MDQPILRFMRLHPKAIVPAYQSGQAAGLDLHAVLEDALDIPTGEILLVPCGFAMAIPPGWEAQVRPRSGLATKHGISMPNAPGTIDADYRGVDGTILRDRFDLVLDRPLRDDPPAE